MSSGFVFFYLLVILVLFGWYFATDYGPKRRWLAAAIVTGLLVLAVYTIWPPEKKIALGLDIKGGTSFLIRLQQIDKEKPTTERLLVKKKADLGGERVSGSNAYYGNEGWAVQLRFDSEGAKKFGQITEQYKGHRFAIVLDGVIQSAPVIRDAIYGGDAVITGKFDEKEARGLASVLQNPLQTPVNIEEERSVSPTLGMDSIRASIIAGLMGLVITLACVLIYYRLAGLIASLALIINLILLLGALTMFRFVLTLPGIAGIILTIGLSVDASVLIYERLREEMALGKSLKVALNTAYEKAFSSIFDANVTTLITAAILFWKATGPVKGFAISLT